MCSASLRLGLVSSWKFDGMAKLLSTVRLECPELLDHGYVHTTSGAEVCDTVAHIAAQAKEEGKECSKSHDARPRQRNTT